MKSALVAGAGGFIGHHMVTYLKTKGYFVRGADIKQTEFEPTKADEFLLVDLREWGGCLKATHEMDEVYQLAADMGGIGYISANHADVARNNVLIDAYMLEASYQNNVGKFFYGSSACIYPQYLQDSPEVSGLKEADAYPADPEEGYGWEKLYAEKLCQYYREDKGLQTSIARFHNVYGPIGTFEGGREKAPASICRKVALARDGDEIEVWGDGKQTRSFTYITDCVEGIFRIMRLGQSEALNLGSDNRVTVDYLVDTVCSIASKKLIKRYTANAPQGVRGRNSDNSRLFEVLGWEPRTKLEEGLRATYQWIESKVTSDPQTLLSPSSDDNGRVG